MEDILVETLIALNEIYTLYTTLPKKFQVKFAPCFMLGPKCYSKAVNKTPQEYILIAEKKGCQVWIFELKSMVYAIKPLPTMIETPKRYMNKPLLR